MYVCMEYTKDGCRESDNVLPGPNLYECDAPRSKSVQILMICMPVTDENASQGTYANDAGSSWLPPNIFASVSASVDSCLFE